MNTSTSGPCPRCGGTGWYAYDDMHSKVCEVCCPHDAGWWAPGDPECYGLADDEVLCRRGCGTTRLLVIDSTDLARDPARYAHIAEEA